MNKICLVFTLSAFAAMIDGFMRSVSSIMQLTFTPGGTYFNHMLKMRALLGICLMIWVGLGYIMLYYRNMWGLIVYCIGMVFGTIIEYSIVSYLKLYGLEKTISTVFLVMQIITIISSLLLIRSLRKVKID